MTLSHPNAGPHSPPARRTVFDVFGTRWGAWGLAACATSGLVYYLAWVAPALAPAPPGAQAAFPHAARFLEDVVAWCGDHRRAAVLIAAALLVPGLLSSAVEPRRHVQLAALLGCALAFSYLTLSAPVDRLFEQVRSKLPESRQIPDYLPGQVRDRP